MPINIKNVGEIGASESPENNSNESSDFVDNAKDENPALTEDLLEKDSLLRVECPKGMHFNPATERCEQD